MTPEAPLIADTIPAALKEPETDAPQPAWWRDVLVPAPTARLLQLGLRTVLHCERAQALFELDARTSELWRSLISGETPEAAASGLRAREPGAADASAFTREAAAAWLGTGRLAPAVAVERLAEPPGTVLALSVGEAACTVELRLPPGDDLPIELARVFGHFRVPGSGMQARFCVVSCGPSYAVFDERGPRGLLPAKRVVPEVKAFVTEEVSRATGQGAFLLHAALLSVGGRGLLLSGAPGAGKTTLTVALAGRGLAYASDDVVRVSPSGALEGVRFRPACKEGAWPLLASYAPDLQRQPDHLRADGRRVRFALMNHSVSGDVDSLGWVLLLERRSDARAALEPVEPLDALTALLAGAYAADGQLRTATLTPLVSQLSAADCRRLVYSDLSEAVAAVEALVHG